MRIVRLFTAFVSVLELGVNSYGGTGLKKLLLILLVLLDFVMATATVTCALSPNWREQARALANEPR